MVSQKRTRRSDRQDHDKGRQNKLYKGHRKTRKYTADKDETILQDHARIPNKPREQTEESDPTPHDSRTISDHTRDKKNTRKTRKNHDDDDKTTTITIQGHVRHTDHNNDDMTKTVVIQGHVHVRHTHHDKERDEKVDCNNKDKYDTHTMATQRQHNMSHDSARIQPNEKKRDRRAKAERGKTKKARPSIFYLFRLA